MHANPTTELAESVNQPDKHEAYWRPIAADESNEEFVRAFARAVILAHKRRLGTKVYGMPDEKPERKAEFEAYWRAIAGDESQPDFVRKYARAVTADYRKYLGRRNTAHCPVE
jgi:hypothetical protein